MPYVVTNLHENGSRSVGSRPLTRREAVESVCLRTGRDGAWCAGQVARVSDVTDVEVPGCGLPGYCRVRIDWTDWQR